MIATHSQVPLSPTTFLERTGQTFPKRDAVIHAGGTVCFCELLLRTRRLADVLTELGAAYGDRIALLSENRLQTIEAHFAIPAVGAVIVSVNPWLPSKDIADQLRFCGAKLLIAGDDFLKLHGDAFADIGHLKQILALGGGRDTCMCSLPVVDYETALATASEHIVLDQAIRSEFDPIAINFTSGTTGFPKGVIISHRAAYLHALGQVLMLDLHSATRAAKYLWSLPMFHVNGWGHMWANVAVGATQIVTPAQQSTGFELVDHIKKYAVTHLAGAPRLVRSLVAVRGNESAFNGLTIVTGGAAPSLSLLTQLETMGIRLIHQYGLNETCGPYVVCEEQEDWTGIPAASRTEKRMRQGVATIHAGTGLRVVDNNMDDVPADGTTLGEVIMAGNTVATGYYNNEEASKKSFIDGWFHSGDMAIVHDDGYIEIKDRIKDLIYVETEYGWENISSIEVENAIGQYAGIKDVAVVGLTEGDDGKEGTLLIAFLETTPDIEITEMALERYCAQALATYKQPHYFFFAELPKTATGKIRKDLLVKDASERIALLARERGSDGRVNPYAGDAAGRV